MQAAGRFRYSLVPFKLWDGAVPVRLTGRQEQLLGMLLRARGRIVPKQMLLRKVWADARVEEANLTQTIFTLRKKLGSLPDGSSYIENVSGKGYRVAPAAVSPDPGKAGGESDGAPDGVFRALVQSVVDCSLTLLDCTGRVTTWNRGAQAITGYAAGQVTGEHFSLFFTPEDVAERAPDQQLAEAAEAGRFNGEGWRVRKNGERFWAGTSLSVVRDSLGGVLGFAEVVRDLTEQKRSRDALLYKYASLRRQHEHLRATVKMGTDALSLGKPAHGEGGEAEGLVLTYLNRLANEIVHTAVEKPWAVAIPAPRSSGRFEALPPGEQAAACEVSR